MDQFARLRRSSFTPSFNQTNEPLIVVEESEIGECEETVAESINSTPKYSLDIDSPVNPYLLSPWRDSRETRKHSLPTPACTSGITASQVRRLSERGAEQITPREQEFLATLSQSTPPQPGGRRHSVVTICKVPTTVFGRSRRESIAVCATGTRTNSRRDSAASVGPPSTDPRGSVHKIQLDMMDDILQTKKARMKLWNTSSEKVCEIQPLNDASTSSPLRYTNRRYSDFITTTLPPIQSFRRASENPNMISPSIREHPVITETPKKKAGIICSNTDLMSLLTSLASSATEINRMGETSPQKTFSRTAATTPSTLAPPIDPARKNRSNSFDVSILHSIKQIATGTEEKTSTTPEPSTGASWFAKRHQTMEKKSAKPAHPTVTFAKEALDRFREKEVEIKKPASKRRSPLNRLKWDGKSAMVDARMIGSAIEGFLRRDSSSSTASTSSSKGAVPKKGEKKASTSKTSNNKASSWFSSRTDDDTNDNCENSLCSTLKDLFVK